MKSLMQVLQKVFVLEFYRTNASFFLLVLGLAGGFMRSYDHIALAEFFFASLLLLLIPILVWVAFTIKVIRFNLEILSRSENEFVYGVSLLSKRQQWICVSQTLAAQLIPVFFYATFLMLMALKYQIILTVVLVAISCVILLITASAHFIFVLLHPQVQQNRWALTRYINKWVTKPYFLFFPEWIVRREAFMVIGTKLFTGLLLYGVSHLYATDSYDLRLLAMAVVVAFAANVNITGEMHRFDNFHFSIIRNLPIPFTKRLYNFFIPLILLTLPEAGIILKNFPAPFNYVDLLSLLFLGWSILLLLYGSLYLRNATPERQTTLIFFGAIGMIVLILFGVPLLVLGVVNSVVGLLIWKRFYYRFEYNEI